VPSAQSDVGLGLIQCVTVQCVQGSASRDQLWERRGGGLTLLNTDPLVDLYSHRVTSYCQPELGANTWMSMVAMGSSIALPSNHSCALVL